MYHVKLQVSNLLQLRKQQQNWPLHLIQCQLRHNRPSRQVDRTSLIYFVRILWRSLRYSSFFFARCIYYSWLCCLAQLFILLQLKVAKDNDGVADKRKNVARPTPICRSPQLNQMKDPSIDKRASQAQSSNRNTAFTSRLRSLLTKSS